MRALVLSDIHGEESRLRWMLEETWKMTGKIDGYFFLGDGVDDFAQAENFIRRRDPDAQMLDVRGNNDAVEDGVNGYLVPVGDSGMMAEKILELMNDREKLRTFGENGLDMVRDFSIENVNREMLTIYSNLGLI